MTTLTDKHAAILARFVAELMPDNMRDEEAYGWTEAECDQLDEAYEVLNSNAEPLLQLRLTGYGPDDGIVVGPLTNIEVMPGTDYIGVQHAGDEEYEELVISGYHHVFVEVAGTGPGGAS